MLAKQSFLIKHKFIVESQSLKIKLIIKLPASLSRMKYLFSNAAIDML